MLYLPFRRTYPVKLGDAIKDYISNKHNQHPSIFADDLKDIDQLRLDATNVLEPHTSGVRKLQHYAAQLVWIGGKFPIDVRRTFV